jgi:hypothetical protein
MFLGKREMRRSREWSESDVGREGGRGTIHRSPYACEPSVHLIGSTDVNEPPTISAGRFTNSLKVAVPFALKMPRTPSIYWAKRAGIEGDERE